MLSMCLKFICCGKQVVQYDGRTVEGYLLRYHGCDHVRLVFSFYIWGNILFCLQEVIVRTPKQHEFSQHMLPPDEKDTSQFVLCPMPGTLVSISKLVFYFYFYGDNS